MKPFEQRDEGVAPARLLFDLGVFFGEVVELVFDRPPKAANACPEIADGIVGRHSGIRYFVAVPRSGLPLSETCRARCPRAAAEAISSAAFPVARARAVEKWPHRADELQQ